MSKIHGTTEGEVAVLVSDHFQGATRQGAAARLLIIGAMRS